MNAVLGWANDWWRTAQFGAAALALMASPSTYGSVYRRPMLTELYRSTAALLPWFCLLCALVSLILTRILLVTAQSYGLSRYALEMVVRVLVLELIPLSAALFVAMRYSILEGAQLMRMRRRGELAGLTHFDDHSASLRSLLVPRAAAGVISVVSLAIAAGVLSLIIAYTLVYGLTPWGFDAYTRMVGRVFSPAVFLIFTLKTLLFALAVGIIPISACLQGSHSHQSTSDATLASLIRMFVVILGVEVLSLVGSYI
jgi:phospholipid/cholesterol/gamma-HCH transport system permease protein